MSLQMKLLKSTGTLIFAGAICFLSTQVIAQHQPELEDYYRILETLQKDVSNNGFSEDVPDDFSTKGLQTPQGMIYPTGMRSGRPVYGESLDIGFSQATKADLLWPGGSSGYNVTGSGVTIGVWEFSGYPLPTMPDF